MTKINKTPTPEQQLANELNKRGYNRRQFLKIGTMLGMGGASLAALSACAAPPAAAPGAAVAPAVEPTAAEAAAAPVAVLFDATEGAGGAWPKSNIAEPASAVTLSVAHAWDATFFERQKQFDELFMKRHPNITITAENSPWGDLLQKYTTQAAGGALPDISYIHFSWAQQMIKSGLLQSLDDYIAQEKDFNLEDFFPASLPSYKRDGKLWVIPYDEGPMVLYYNKDLFDKAGVAYPTDSWTFDDFKAAAEKITTGEGPNKVFGFGNPPGMGDSTVSPTWLAPFGASYVNEPEETKCLANSPEAVAAMEYWQDFRTKGLVPAPADTASLAWPAFQHGRIGMWVDGTWATPPIQAGSKFKWDMAKFPKGPKAHVMASAGSGYGISRECKTPDAAWIYLNDYLSTAGQAYMWGITGRGSPARLSAWPSYLGSKFAPAGAKNAQEELAGLAKHDILDQPAASKVTQAAGAIWDNVVAGTLPVKDALDQICAAIDPILAENAAK